MQDYAASQGNSFIGGGNATTPYPPSTQVQAAAPTLVRALSSIEELNKRLYQLCAQANEIAQAVGGPYPVGGEGKADAPQMSAMQKLNDAIATAHGTVGNLENALSAMRRALGA